MTEEPSAKAIPDRLEDLSIEEIVTSLRHQRANSQRLLTRAILATAAVALISALIAFWLYLDSQNRFDGVVRELDARTLQYNEELAAKDAKIAELNQQLLDLSHVLVGGRVLAVGSSGVTIEECRITLERAILVDMNLVGCARLATFSNDGQRIAIVTRTGLLIVYDINGSVRFQITISPKVIALEWDGDQVLLQTEDGRLVFGPDGQQIDIPMTNVVREEYTVFLQFAGAIARGDIVTLAQQVDGLGWQVQGAQQGGERVGDTYGFNEIRYSDEKDKEAAALLAQEVAIAATGIGLNVDVKVALVAGIKPGTLEIWLSRP